MGHFCFCKYEYLKVKLGLPHWSSFLSEIWYWCARLNKHTSDIYWSCLCVLPPAVLSELATGSTDSELLWQTQFPRRSKLCRGQRLLPPTDKQRDYMDRKLDFKVSLIPDVYLKTYWLSHPPVWKPQIAQIKWNFLHCVFLSLSPLLPPPVLC